MRWEISLNQRYPHIKDVFHEMRLGHATDLSLVSCLVYSGAVCCSVLQSYVRVCGIQLQTWVLCLAPYSVELLERITSTWKSLARWVMSPIHIYIQTYTRTYIKANRHIGSQKYFGGVVECHIHSHTGRGEATYLRRRVWKKTPGNTRPPFRCAVPTYHTRLSSLRTRKENV